MNAAELYLDAMGRADGTLRRSLEDLSLDELRAQPAGAGSNPIGWLVWHISRGRASPASGITGSDSAGETGARAPPARSAGELPPIGPDGPPTVPPRAPWREAQAGAS